MKAFRNVGGKVVEIQVDVGADGQPLLPPDTTVSERPSPMKDHYVTVVGSAWVQIPKPVEFKTLDTLKDEAEKKLKEWSVWYFEQPIMHDGVKFDADAKARERLTQCVLGALSGLGFPPVWVAYDDSFYPLESGEKLKELAGAVISVAFRNRFFEYNTIRNSIRAAETEEALAAVVIPAIERG